MSRKVNWPFIRYGLLAVIALLLASFFATKANADVLVLSGPPSAYNSSVDGQCSGALEMTWKKPTAAGLVVRPQVVAAPFWFWVRWDDVQPTMKIAVSTTALEGPAKCSEITGGMTKAEILTGGSPVPTPTPTPPTPTTSPTPSAPGEMLLTWAAATANTDDTPLTDLIGYRINYGTALDALSTVVDVGIVTTHTITGLAAGTWYATIITRSGGGLSKPTNPTTKIVTAMPVPTPTPTPTPVPVPVVATIGFAAGVTQIPVWGLTTTNTRSSTLLGVIDVGVPCIGAQLTTYRSQGYRRVPKASVKWHETTPTDNAIAACK